jgi:hypothetical protein
MIDSKDSEAVRPFDGKVGDVKVELSVSGFSSFKQSSNLVFHVAINLLVLVGINLYLHI